MKYLKDFVRAFLAGTVVSVGCVVFLSVSDTVAGSLLFSLGLLTVLVFDLNLFTGKGPYMVKNKPSYALFVLLVWLGNFAGTAFSALLVRFTRAYGAIIERCTEIAEVKVNDSLLSLLILGMFCGIMMYIAVDTFINHGKDKEILSVLVVVLCISVFILAGFEHSVADMFYFTLALPVKKWIVPLLVITLGNVIGGNAFCFLTKLKK